MFGSSNTGAIDAWKNVQNLVDAKALIDRGVLLGWADAKRIAKSLSVSDNDDLCRHLAIRLSEQNESRLIDEMLLETLFGVLATATSEKAYLVFLETFLTQPDALRSAMRISEVALTLELVDPEHDDQLYSTAVTLICELGLAIKDLSIKYPEQFPNAAEAMDHIATYLLSVSNTNSSRIRLSLFNYFGVMETGVADKFGFNKVISRFGHTALDQLFTLLFNKKTEAVAFQYLIENLPFVLEGDRHAQTILHETWKFYMLKNPDRFGLFLKSFCDHYKTLSAKDVKLSRRPLHQHMGALMRVAAEVNHRELVQSIINSLVTLGPSQDRIDVVNAILEIQELRSWVRAIVLDLKNSVDSKKIIESAAKFIDSKRGRKPSFARVEGWVTMNQVQFLGSQVEVLPKAS